MVRRALAVLATAAVALAVTLGAAAAPSQAAPTSVPSEDAVPGIAPPGADETAVYLDSTGRVFPTTGSPSVAQSAVLAACTPESGRDNPHYSGGDVSGHGWWKKGTCNNNTAKVYNCLYEWYTDNTWRQKACSPTLTLPPYTGSGARTVARATCNDTSLTSWRNHVDVDVVGEDDTSEWPYNQASVGCRVY